MSRNKGTKLLATEGIQHAISQIQRLSSQFLLKHSSLEFSGLQNSVTIHNSPKVFCGSGNVLAQLLCFITNLNGAGQILSEGC